FRDDMLPLPERLFDGPPALDLDVGVRRSVGEQPPVLADVQVPARGDVLVGVHQRVVDQLDLTHPHEPANELEPDEIDEWLPVWALDRTHSASEGTVAGHGRAAWP